MTNSVIDRLQRTFATAEKLTAEDLAGIYTSDIIFVDPLGRVEGLDKLSRYLDGVYKNVVSCRFEYLDVLQIEGKASIKWDMVFQHKKLAAGRAITVRGVTLIEFNEKIFFHEDIYDVGALVYENVPVLGAPVRYLKKRAHSAAFKGT